MSLVNYKGKLALVWSDNSKRYISVSTIKAKGQPPIEDREELIPFVPQHRQDWQFIANQWQQIVA